MTGKKGAVFQTVSNHLKAIFNAFATKDAWGETFALQTTVRSNTHQPPDVSTASLEA